MKKFEKKKKQDSTQRKIIPLVLISILTACWYGASSSNAVATQRLVKEFGSAGGFDNNDRLDTPQSSPLSVMLVLTAMQLITGLCISFPLYYYLRSISESSPVAQTTTPLPQIAVGTLHFLGCFCTNMGFALGSASVVQVIKLLEPIETLFLTALANLVIKKVSHGLTLTKSLSVFTIVFGTMMLLAQKKSDQKFGNDVNG